MARNIEIKARIASIEALLPRARALADGEPMPLAQVDTFFHAAHGRLKLRQLGDGQAELIHYQRADSPEARASDYVRVPVAEPVLLAQALARAHGERGRVQKIRWLLQAGQTRIHLDRVQDLGDFIELEVVLKPGQSDAEGRQIAETLMQRLGLADAPRLAVAYIDLLGSTAAQQTDTR